MESSAELKERYDQYVAKDSDMEKRVNSILHVCLGAVTEEMKKEEDFGQLFQEFHFSGSYYDKLAVGNIRQEFDINVVFGIPEESYVIRNSNTSNSDPNHSNFLNFEVTSQNNTKTRLIMEQGRVSAAKMKAVLKTSVDRSLTRLKNTVVLESGERVRVTRSEGLPVTLKLNSGSVPDIDVDLVPVLRSKTIRHLILFSVLLFILRFSLSKLPRDLQYHVATIQGKVGSEEEQCLGVALPEVKDHNRVAIESRLEVDFPQIARRVLAGRPSARMAVKLLKQERDRVGGQFKQVKSFIIKTVALNAVLMNPDPDHWAEKHLGQRHRDIRNSLQSCLLTDRLQDVFFPSVNVMTRIKSMEVKREVGKYLQKSADPTRPVKISWEEMKRVYCRLYRLLKANSKFGITRCHAELTTAGVSLAVFVDVFNFVEVLEDWRHIVLTYTEARESKTVLGLGVVLEEVFIVILPIAKSLASKESLLVGSRMYEGKKPSVEVRKAVSDEAKLYLMRPRRCCVIWLRSTGELSRRQRLINQEYPWVMYTTRSRTLWTRWLTENFHGKIPPTVTVTGTSLLTSQ